MNVDYIRSRIKDKKSLILFDNAYEFASKRLMGVVYNENQSLMNYLLEIVSILLDYNVDIDTIISSILCYIDLAVLPLTGHNVHFLDVRHALSPTQILPDAAPATAAVAATNPHSKRVFYLLSPSPVSASRIPSLL